MPLLLLAALLTPIGSGVSCEIARQEARSTIASWPKIRAALSQPNRKLIFSYAFESGSSFEVPTRGWTDQSGRKMPPPPRTLRNKFSKATRQSALEACPALHHELVALGFGVGDEAVDAIGEPDAQFMYSADTAGITLPVISTDGRMALYATNSVSGPLAAGGIMVFARKQIDGTWRVVSSATLWVS